MNTKNEHKNTPHSSPSLYPPIVQKRQSPQCIPLFGALMQSTRQRRHSSVMSYENPRSSATPRTRTERHRHVPNAAGYRVPSRCNTLTPLTSHTTGGSAPSSIQKGPKPTARRAVPRGQVSPGAEDVKRTFVGYGWLVWVIRGECGICRRDELRSTRVERLRGAVRMRAGSAPVEDLGRQTVTKQLLFKFKH